jgi:hypothetical protein
MREVFPTIEMKLHLSSHQSNSKNNVDYVENMGKRKNTAGKTKTTHEKIPRAIMRHEKNPRALMGH